MAPAAPDELAPTVTELVPLPPNVAVAPLEGAVNVIGLPATGDVTGHPFVLTSATCSPDANAVPSLAVCGEPSTITSRFGEFQSGQSGEASTAARATSPASRAA